MSYILDALRKSEKERRAKQPESVTDRILTQQYRPAPKRRTALWIGLAFSAILILIAGFFWLSQPEPEIVSAQKPQTRSAASMPTLDAAQAPTLTEQTPSQNAPASQGGLLDPSVVSRPTASRNAPLALRKKSMLQNNPEKPGDPVVRSEQPDTTPKPIEQAAPVITEPDGDGDVDADVEDDIESDNPADFVEDEEPAPILSQSPSLAAKPEGPIPFFEELPFEVRQSIPKMTINVVYYSTNPAERFAIINMQKYKVGQRTKDSVDLKEIRRNSLVFNFQNQNFQLERP